MDLEALKIDRAATAGGTSRVRRRSWIGWVVALVAIAVCLYALREPLRGVYERVSSTEVETTRVIARQPSASLSGVGANGYVVARTRAALSADTPGRIVEMNVEEGSVVKKGDVVARLYADEYRAALERAAAELTLAEAGLVRAEAGAQQARAEHARAQSAAKGSESELADAQATLQLAEAEHTRAEQLLSTGVGSQQALDKARSDLTSARARVALTSEAIETARHAAQEAEAGVAVADAILGEARASVEISRAARELAQATLDKTEVRAPFAGVVVLKDAEVGEVVSPNVQGGTSARGSVVTMVDFESLEVQAEVSERALASVKVGAPARMFLDAYPEHAYAGRVERIWPTANRQKATVEVRVAFAERDDRLRPEMSVRVVFLDAEPDPQQARAAPTVLIPESAVVERDGTVFVFLVEDGRARLTPVVLGEERGDQRVVESGVEGGETIVKSPPSSLVDGARVIEKDVR